MARTKDLYVWSALEVKGFVRENIEGVETYATA
jgi:hypothetical protein